MHRRVATSLGLALSAALPLAIATAPLLLACRPTTMPPSGDALGTFVVQGALVENTCAPGFEPNDPLAFRVELSRNGTSLTWRMPGGPPVPGSLSASGAILLRTTSQVQAWAADPANGVVGCTVSQTEIVQGTLLLPGESADGGTPSSDAAVDGDGGANDAGRGNAGDGGVSDVASFTATNRIEIAPVAGSDCSGLLLVNGGSFPSLPCAARYDLTAVVE